MTASVKSKAKSLDWHDKIAQNRGKRWRDNMLAGRREALLNPSKIRLARLQQKLDQSTIAKLLKLTKSTYGAIERGKRKVKKDVAQKITIILKHDIKELFLKTDNKYVAITNKAEF